MNFPALLEGKILTVRAVFVGPLWDDKASLQCDTPLAPADVGVPLLSPFKHFAMSSAVAILHKGNRQALFCTVTFGIWPLPGVLCSAPSSLSLGAGRQLS